MRKILVATDFSECSRKAIHYAVSLAKQFKAEVLIVHVFEPVPPQMAILEGVLMNRSFREDAAQHLDSWRRQVARVIKAASVIRTGTPAYRQIVAVARETEADLIIVGNHGRNTAGTALMGATAEKVVRFASCPVLVIREHENDFVSETG